MNTSSWLEELRGSDRWRALISRRSPGILAALLALALAAQAAVIVTDLAGGAAPPRDLTPRWRPHPRRTGVTRIVRGHLFGRAPASTQASDAPRTDLPLVLTGVLAAENPDGGLAILGPSVQTAKVYSVGDSIPGGARLDAVLPRKVLLRRGGQLESLALPQKSLRSGPPPSASRLPSSPMSAPRFVARMRELVSRRPGIIADLLRPEPVFSGGRQVGYRVYPGKDRSAFTRLGLQAGDLVTAINGAPLNDPSQDEQILDTLGSSSQATVTVLRHGHQQELTLNLAEVEQAAQSLTTPHRARQAKGSAPPSLFPQSNGSHRPPSP